MLLELVLTDEEIVERYLRSMAVLKLYREVASELDLPLPTRVVGFIEVTCSRTPSMGHAKVKCLVETKEGIGVMEYYETRDEHDAKQDISWVPQEDKKVA
jgi:hypothetical protein